MLNRLIISLHMAYLSGSYTHAYASTYIHTTPHWLSLGLHACIYTCMHAFIQVHTDHSTWLISWIAYIHAYASAYIHTAPH